MSADITMARGCVLARRLTPVWQDEVDLLIGLRVPHMQMFLVTTSGLAERRRIGGLNSPVSWQLRLAGGAAALAQAVIG
jgi:hypothetical protein